MNMQILDVFYYFLPTAGVVAWWGFVLWNLLMNFRVFSYFCFLFYEIYSLTRGLIDAQVHISYFNKSITNLKKSFC